MQYSVLTVVQRNAMYIVQLKYYHMQMKYSERTLKVCQNNCVSMDTVLERQLSTLDPGRQHLRFLFV